MSSDSIYGAWEQLDVPRQSSHCRIIVYSHITDNDKNGEINCSMDVVNCSTGKTIKGGGHATFALVPRQNYMNYIFPGDWVNIYFDPGDGRGFIRTFFGFVDRIERNITVSSEGVSNTSFQVSCSDFTKAFTQTAIYFNPHIGDRADFVGLFSGTKNLAGAALRTRGISCYGTPADIVLNLAHLLLGFGAQFIMPPSYPDIGSVSDYFRRTRLKWVKSRFTKDVQDLIGADTVSQWLDKMKAVAGTYKALLRKGEVAEVSNKILTSPAFETLKEKKEIIDQLNQITADYLAGGETKEQEIDALLLELLIESIGINAGEVQVAVEIESLLSKRHLLDLLDFSFVEYEAIDGSIVSTPIWTQQGSLWSIMNSYSNDVVNELFCDLRPLSLNYASNGIVSGGYDNGPDELKYSPSDIANSSPPVHYVPALIFREYPFSTIESVNVFSKILDVDVENIYIGAIFSKTPGHTGRVVNNLIRPLNDYVYASNKQAKAYKHLDVVAIQTNDIINETVGRSDHDVCNLMEMYSDGLMGKHAKFMTQDLQPICTPISIARYGLRVRTYETRFARFSSKLQTNQGIDNVGTRYKLARWIIMLDHWFQHNIEYLNGTITTRAFPELRVGYRLDITDRNESYYIDGVNHSWHYPEPMTTTITVSRGQRYDPYPVYIKPHLPRLHGERQAYNSRLALFFKQVDPNAVRRGLSASEQDYETLLEHGNVVDDPNKNVWGEAWEGYLAAEANELPTDIVTNKQFEGFLARSPAPVSWSKIFGTSSSQEKEPPAGHGKK